MAMAMALAMEKLKGAVLKLCNSHPNPPLSVTQNIILEERLSQFLSILLHTSPDHPPYAMMIERALQQLSEKGGSTEDSISKFIRKEFDNLPWAHVTLLKHHLSKMSKNGDILLVYGQRYLLPPRNSSLVIKHQKRKQCWDSERERKKRHKVDDWEANVRKLSVQFKENKGKSNKRGQEKLDQGSRKFDKAIDQFRRKEVSSVEGNAVAEDIPESLEEKQMESVSFQDEYSVEFNQEQQSYECHVQEGAAVTNKDSVCCEQEKVAVEQKDVASEGLNHERKHNSQVTTEECHPFKQDRRDGSDQDESYDQECDDEIVSDEDYNQAEEQQMNRERGQGQAKKKWGRPSKNLRGIGSVSITKHRGLPGRKRGRPRKEMH